MGRVGVVIGRFQVHELHHGHLDIFKRALHENGKLLVLIGNSHVIHTRRDPLDYQTRCRMIQGHFPGAMISFIKNRETDEQWSQDIDKIIRELCPLDTPTLYGGRDSFIPYYHGRHKTVEVFSYDTSSGTEIRDTIVNEPVDSSDFRKGVIYSAYNRYPRLHGTVDIACLSQYYENVILVKKPSEDKWRFPGGFVDIKDPSFEMAARREFGEEVGCEVSNWRFIGSCRVEDWRYRGIEDSEYIMTTFFLCLYNFGDIQGRDDVSDGMWFNLKYLKNNKSQLIECHHVLIDMLYDYVDKNLAENIS